MRLVIRAGLRKIRRMGEAKRKNQRDCPALGRSITAQECGGSRNSKIPCPIDCPHNPFATKNYHSSFFLIEGRVIKKLIDLTNRGLSFAEQREMFGTGEPYEVHAFFSWHLIGRAFLSEWLKSGALESWKNDERILAEFMLSIRVCLFETLRVHDSISIIVRDLLRPELGEIRLIDPAFVDGACRYNVHLGWSYQVPGGRRASGSILPLDDVGDREPVEFFEILVRHLGAPDEDRDLWLLENMVLLQDAIIEVANARRNLSLARSDLNAITRVYSLEGIDTGALADQLAAHPRIDTQEHRDGRYAASLLERPGDSPGVNSLLGDIKIHDGLLTAESFSRPRTEALTEFLLSLEPDLQLVDEKIVDHAKQMEPGPKTIQHDLVPEELLEDAIAICVARHRVPEEPADSANDRHPLIRDVMGSPVPMLDHLTPPEAAARPELRQKLIRLMKTHVRIFDRMRVEEGVDLDLNPELKELGLDELIQPPPPLGHKSGSHSAVISQPPHQPRMGRDEALDRIAMHFNVVNLMAEMIVPYEDFFDAIVELPRDDFSETDSQMLTFAAFFAVFALHPDPPPHFRPNPDRLTDWFDEMYEESFAFQRVRDDALDLILEKCGQPELVNAVFDFALEAGDRTGNPLDEDSYFEFLLAIAAVVWEASHWPWKR